MKTTGIFKTHYYRIPVKNGEKIYLVPFGDIHRNAPLCSEEYWGRFLDQYRNDHDRVFFLGMGDYDDLCSASEREILANPNIHESTAQNLNKYAEEKVKAICEEISFMKGHLVGLLGGNHYWDFPSGINSDMMMAQILDTKYLGVSAFIRLCLAIQADEGTGVHSASIDIWAHHGKGAARLMGGSINRVAQMREAGEADIYIMGHDHRKGAVPSGSKLELFGPGARLKVRHKVQWLVRSGSFLRGYVEDESSYVADAAMNPTDLGTVSIELTANRMRVNDEDTTQVEIHART